MRCYLKRAKKERERLAVTVNAVDFERKKLFVRRLWFSFFRNYDGSQLCEIVNNFKRT